MAGNLKRWQHVQNSQTYVFKKKKKILRHLRNNEEMRNKMHRTYFYK